MCISSVAATTNTYNGQISTRLFQNIIQENNIADIDSKLTTGSAFDDATLTALSKLHSDFNTFLPVCSVNLPDLKP